MLKLEPGQPPLLGERFELVGSIDHTGTTWSYLAWDREESRWVTVRMLSFRAAVKPVARSRFQRELRCLRKVRHPNVLEVYAAEPDHELHPWAAVGVAEAGSVADWMGSHGKMPAYLAIDVMAHVCSALSAAHRAGVSHGALKLEHVLIDRNGHIRLSGLRGGGDRNEVLADVRAAGALLFTMVTGRAWDDKQSKGLLRSIPSAIARPIEKTRSGRGGYADVGTFSRDLEAAVLELPMPSGNVPPLAAADVVLPEDPAEVIDPSAEFPELQHFLMRAADPSYDPGEELTADPPTPVSDGLMLPSAGSRKQAFEPAPASEADRSMPAMPYQMSRASKTQEDTDSDNWTFGDKPLYEDAPDPKADDWQHWDPKEGAEEEVEKVEPPKPFLDEKMLGRLVILAAVLFIASIVGTIGWGAAQVGEARVETEALAGTLVEDVRADSQLVYAMGSAGADRKALEDAYFAFAEAPNDVARVQAAIRFAQLIDHEAGKAGLDPVQNGGIETPLWARIDKVSEAHRRMQAKKQVWAARAGGFPGIIPVAIGIQIAPPY